MRDLMSDLANNQVDSNDESFREELRRAHERKKKKWMISVVFYLFIGITFMIVGGKFFQEATEVKGMLFGVLIILIGYEMTILTKLAYMGIFQLYTTLMAIKEAHLDILEKTSDEDIAERARNMVEEV